MYSFKTAVIGDVMFHLADLIKTFFLAHELKTSPVICSMTLPHYIRYLKYQEECTPSTTPPPFSYYRYHIRKKL